MNLFENIYNKEENQELELADLPEEARLNYYVLVAELVQDIESATYASYNSLSTFRLSVGNNSFVEAPVLKIDGKKLYVATAVLALEVSGNKKVTINSKEYTIESAGALDSLTVSDIKSSGDVHTALVNENNITFIYNTPSQTWVNYLFFELGSPVTNSDVALVRMVKNNVVQYALTATKEDIGTGIGVYPKFEDDAEMTLSFLVLDNEGVVGSSSTYSITSRIGITVSLLVEPTEYGSLSFESLNNVPYGSTCHIDGNKLTIASLEVVATPLESSGSDEFVYSFVSWSVNDGDLLNSIDPSITATFTKTKRVYYITLDKNTEDAVTGLPEEVQYVNVGDDYTLPSAPSRVGYYFTGWNKAAIGEGTPIEATLTGIEADTTIYARWKVKDDLSVNVEAGTELGSVNVSQITGITYGDTFVIDNNTLTINGITVTATPLAATNHTLYVFVSWSVENGDTMPDQDGMTITATFAAVDHHTITFKYPTATDAAGGEFEESLERGTYILNSSAKNEWENDYPVLGKYYEFVGWYTDLTYATQVTMDDLVLSDMTIYAKYVSHNVLKAGDLYFHRSENDVVISSRYASLGDLIYGKNEFVKKNSNDWDFDLQANSGVYKLEKDDEHQTYTILRKIGSAAQDHWWDDDNHYSYFWCFGSSVIEGGYLYGGVNVDGGYVYIDHSYTKVIMTRYETNGASGTSFHGTNQTAEMNISDSSSSAHYIYESNDNTVHYWG